MSQHAAEVAEKEPAPIHRLLLRSSVFRASIWGPTGVDEDDDRVASLLRIWLPITYATSAAFGVFGFIFGIPAIFDAISPTYGFIWSEIVVLGSLAALVGVAFPAKLWRLDQAANAIIVMCFGVYTVCLMYLAFHQPPVDGRAQDRAALAIGSLRLIYLPFWRVLDISRDRLKHHWR